MPIFTRLKRRHHIRFDHDTRAHHERDARSTTDLLIERREKDSLEYLKLAVPPVR